ncbi:hypothetical protein DL764_003838 [Monosporascus ibericus]|uniref:Tubby C-terminal domain-containing protein n=1 Tax=Monosporascus ibericus TaxID=155417 RepID=A0A4Q4TJH6_9PEZI|nr:hypothetical protein DL764_003838 [Monosporascus ibericus]
MMVMNPYPTPLGLFPGFIARQTETLMIKEKGISLSGDSFTIKTVGGQPVFDVKGNFFSLSGRKVVTDIRGNHLFTIRKKLLALQSTYYAEGPAGNPILEVIGKFGFTTRKFVGRFISASGQKEDLRMTGDFFHTSAQICGNASRSPVAIIERDFFNMREFFLDKQTYAVTIAPNVDMAIVVAMCICLDERRTSG